jgi:hypothetical protein
MSLAKTAETSQYIDNYEHDDLFNAKQVTDVGSDKQILVDKAVAGTTYVGIGARGLATTATGWLLKKIVKAGTDTTINHAIDTWTNRNTTAVYS